MRKADKPVLLSASLQLTAKQKRNMGVSSYVKREREPNEALGQQVNKMAGVYSQKDDTFFRNDGHKHLKSLGVLC